MKKSLKPILCWLNKPGCIHFNKVFFFFGSSISLCFLILFLAGCKKKDLIGLHVQPETEQLGLITTDTATLITSTLWVDSVRSDEAAYNLLGTYYDPDFGVTEASLYTQVRLSTTNVDFGNVNDMEVDSAVLSFTYYTYYGKLDPQSYIVYRVAEDIEKDSIYYSNKYFDLESGIIGGIYNFRPDLEDSITINGINEPPQMRIKLNKDFGEELLHAGASVYSDNDNFIKQFKGFYVKPAYTGASTAQPDTSRIMPFSGTGAILTLDLTQSASHLVLYYHDINSNETFQYEYYINEKTARVNRFKHIYNGTNVKNAVDNQEISKITGYVQPMAGVKTKIEMPFINDFVKNGKVAINKAELIISSKISASSDFPPPAQLFLTGIDSSGKSIFILDQFYNESYYGGDYDMDNNDYHFVITRHIQDVLNAHLQGNEKNHGMYLVAGGESINANRLIFNGPESPAASLKIIISYTPL